MSKNHLDEKGSTLAHVAYFPVTDLTTVEICVDRKENFCEK